MKKVHPIFLFFLFFIGGAMANSNEDWDAEVTTTLTVENDLGLDKNIRAFFKVVTKDYPKITKSNATSANFEVIKKDRTVDIKLLKPNAKELKATHSLDNLKILILIEAHDALNNPGLIVIEDISEYVYFKDNAYINFEYTNSIKLSKFPVFQVQDQTQGELERLMNR